METKYKYLIGLIVIIVGIIAIFSLSFVLSGDENLTGAAIWGGGGECEGWSRDISMEQPTNKRDCEAAGGTWKKVEAA